LQDVVDEAVLSEVEALHQIGRDVGRELEGKVAIGASFCDLLN